MPGKKALHKPMNKERLSCTTIAFLALQIREEIDRIPIEELPILMAGFPNGSCGDAAMLLGAYLADYGFSDFDYVSGHRGNTEDNSWTSHAWLACGELVADITADQFPDAPAGVIVESPSPWHQEFEVEQRGPCDFKDFSEIPHLKELYSRLTSSLFFKE